MLVVLAGGFGSRLRSVVSDVPKPLAPIGSTPFLDFLINSWLEQGVRSFLFLLHYEANKIISFIDQQRNSLLAHCQVDYLIEDRPLGTGGSIKNAIDAGKIKDDFLVCNADTWLGVGVQAMQEAGCPSLAVTKVENRSRYGGVMFDGNQFVTAFQEKGQDDAGWINAGMYNLSVNHFIDVAHTCFSIETEMLPKLVGKEGLRAVPLDAHFFDIGVPDDYVAFIEARGLLGLI